ncbi:hypothetical protein EN978_07165 [Mesorhizobium sp. M7A.F.Ca.US.001.04.1.1]|uniref:hypothetical protein n=1 Tax=unclassified Mesorhizobium TaxID=325217 RepID=UPI000FCA689E|nr:MULTISPECIES: hypothetical protein [unclassified Mesorhizobium]RUY31707.1 hypothetical protein EN979_02115 [Mesorhizobium sp. M7A.F.Ca.US.001.04.2.1]RUY44105.1 hypothetical protein EN978_07165 [Mesorhizobium sp. M7A.F.Ca.US.001.04.1.1]
MIGKWFKPWGTLLKWLNRYRRAYGGIRGMLASPFFGLAVLITGLSYSLWVEPKWIEKAETLIPSLLGFSLGTYAIIFSIVGGRIKGALRQVSAPHGVSYLEAVNAVFFHYIFVQVVCLAWAFLYQGTWLYDLTRVLEVYVPSVKTVFLYASLTGSFIGCFLLVYSVLLMIAAALAVYRLALLKDPSEDAGR